jgi:hypothetical protein
MPVYRKCAYLSPWLQADIPYELLTFHAPIHMSCKRYVARSKESLRVRAFYKGFEAQSVLW